MSRKSAFTLLELLTVIAIIGILSAIIFPVYAQVRVSAYRSSDMSNMNAIRTALQLYKTDQGAYPPQLLGYVTLYTSGPLTGQIIPANQIVGCLYPKRVESFTSFKPSQLTGTDAQYNQETTAVWPSGQYGGVAVAGCTPNAALPACAQQAYKPTDGFVSYDVNGVVGVTGTPFEYYTVSGYDTASVMTPSGKMRELRYALFWSGYGLNSGSASDSINQMGYSEPPENTVVTWNSYYRQNDASGNVVAGGKRDLVLFEGGNARAHDSLDMFNLGYQAQP